MNTVTGTPFLSAVSESLPSDLSQDLQNLLRVSNNDQLLDNLIRFISGGPCSSQSSIDQEQWISKQTVVRNKLSTLAFPTGGQKRPRESDEVGNAEQNGNKRTKGEEESTADDQPLFTLKSVSATSPVRKKVNITIHKSSIRFYNATTNTLEHSSSISSLRRGFLVPTRGKTKPHWTVILISEDAPVMENNKIQASSEGNFQVIFGVDASTTSVMTTVEHTVTPPEELSIKKGEETLPLLHLFISNLPFPVTQPSLDVFKSAFPGAGGVGMPGVEAYRGAKSGSLWFMKDGILWGDGKPCEFWPLEQLYDKSDGLRIVSATGRTLTIFLTRRGEELEEGEAVREETQFGPVDAKEQDAIHQWVKQHRHMFGKQGSEPANANEASTSQSKPAAVDAPSAVPLTLSKAQLDSDDEDDDDFAANSDDDGSNGSASSDDDGDDDGSGDEDEDEDEEDAGGEDADAEEEELNPKHHPLLRPGAMPKMSRAAMDMAVDMVEGDLTRTVGGGSSDGEEDELDD